MGAVLRSIRQVPHIFPLALTVLSVTALVAVNPDEGIRLQNLSWPLGLALVVAFIGWALGCLFASGRTGASLVAGTFIANILFGGYLYGWSSNISIADSSTTQVLLAATTVAASVVLVRTAKSLEPLGHFLDVMTVLLVVYTIPSVVRLTRTPATDLPSPTSEFGSGITNKPDIYLVVLDAYSGLGSLSSEYDFDNRAILDSLRLRGFQIPARSVANYTKTFLSVGSMLNRDYPDELVTAAAPGYTDRRAAYEALEFNQTMIDLKHLGYDIHYIGSSYPPMAVNRLADGPEQTSVSREFEALWLSTTLVPSLRSTWCHFAGCARRAVPFEAESAASTESRISLYLGRATAPGPKFVYMHLLLPHGPFRFGPTCEHRPGVWMTGPTEVADSTGRRLFLDQVRCTNKKILEMADHIRGTSGDSAIILFQSDHGHGRFPGGVPRRLTDSGFDQVRERFDVFAAYMAPGELADSLAAVRSPVNLFRTLFRILWKVREAPLPDLHFWSDPDRPLFPIPVGSDSLAWPHDGLSSPPSREAR